ncbi:MAG: insulinase family protein [Syntrophaceae bacterium]|nr:insulinase family protein [Syntrophaceae bacterium]
MIPKIRKGSSVLFIFVLLFPWLVLLPGTVYAIPPVEKMVFPNGLRLLFCQERSLPFVTFELLIDGGSSRDPSEKEGLSHITAKGLLMGTPKHSLTALNEVLDFMGASLDVLSGRDFTTLTLRILKKDLDKGLDLFMEVLTQPIFPEAEIRREVERTLAAIRSAEDQPGWVAEREFQKALFLGGPYKYPVEGTKESLPQITRESVLRFFRTYYHPNHAILTVVGDINDNEIKTRLLPRLEKWPQSEIPKKVFESVFPKGMKTIKIDRRITQANIILGHVGVSRGNPDFYALSVMNYILGGGGFASRLMEEIRNKRGLAYSVDSFFDAGTYPGSFQVVLQTKNASARKAISIALQQIKRIQEEKVSEKELEGAKKYLVGSFPMRFDTQGKLANFLTQVEYYGLGLDYPEKYKFLIKSVTREEVLRVAKTHLHPENYILVIVANMEEAGMD